MRGRIERLATSIWEGSGPWRLARGLLAPSALLYGGAVAARDAAFRTGLLRSHAVSARVVSIGNLRVGGTGKTPLVRWLAAALSSRGIAVAIVSRGYGGTAEGAHVVGDGVAVLSDVAASGDEAVMLARSAGVPVVAGRDRVAAAALGIARFGSRLLLCDDAFQHRRLRRDLDVVLIDAAEAGGMMRLLPAGPLREPLGALGRADVVVRCEREGGSGAPHDSDTTGANGARAGAAVGGKRLEVRAAFMSTALVHATAGDWAESPLQGLAGCRVLAVSGVARPAPLYASLRAWGAELVHVLEYPDHHAYDAHDWQEISHAAKEVDLVVTTEKDLVKLERFPFARGKLAALRLGVMIDRPEAFLARVLGAHGRPAR